MECLQARKESKEFLTNRSMTGVRDRNLCNVGQTFLDKPLTKLMYTKTEVHMLSVAQTLPDKSFLHRLISITNAHEAVANDVIYHNVCWVKDKRDAEAETIVTENFVKNLHSFFISMVYFLLSLIMLRKKSFSASKC